MKTIDTISGKVLVVEVPEKDISIPEIPLNKIQFGLHNGENPFVNFYTNWGTEKHLGIRHIYNVILPKGNYKILGKLSEISEEDCERFVLGGFCSTNGCNIYKDYIKETSWSGFEIAKESLISLLQSNGIDTSKESEILLIEVL